MKPKATRRQAAAIASEARSYMLRGYGRFAEGMPKSSAAPLKPPLKVFR